MFAKKHEKKRERENKKWTQNIAAERAKEFIMSTNTIEKGKDLSDHSL